MVVQHKIEVFSASCATCLEAVEEIMREAGPSWEVTVLDMHNPSVAARAKGLGVQSVPAVLIDGQVANCCAGRGIDMQVLRAAGLGQ